MAQEYYSFMLNRFFETLFIQLLATVHKGVKYACNQCDQQFTQQNNLTTHIKSKHEGVKYACNQCDQQFTLQRSLTKHIQSIHEGVKYACN